jgi:hypothetical protein
MIRYKYITDEKIINEPPPVLYIYGETNDFHKLLLQIVCLLKKENILINSTNINIFDNIIILEMDNKNNNGVSIDKKNNKVKISFNYENWLDIFIALLNISITPSTIYMEPSENYPFEWTKALDFLIILESK